MYKSFFKRLFDAFFALLLLLVLSPTLVITFVALYLFVTRKPFFVQPRPGKNENIFSIIKFRTMNNALDENGALLPDHLRLTKLGTFLRKSSLDELPQLINVLKGDMSFIGPRPLLVRYLPYYTAEERIRHSVRPGITGLAQVSGRNQITWEDKLQKDIEYVQHLSFSADLKIICKTIRKVLVSEDVVLAPGSFIIDFDEHRK